ncbi:hypothetical protein D9M68_792670 [compost metagenome]
MQFLAVTAIGVGEHGNVGLGLFGREDHHFLGRNAVDLLGNLFGFMLFGQVDRLAVLDLEQIALQEELAVVTGIQLAAALELNLIQTGHLTLGNRFDGQVWLDRLQALADHLIGVGGQAQAAGQAEGHGCENAGHAHGYS